MTLTLGFAAVNTGNNLLYLLVSALLGFMAVSGVLGQRNIAAIALRVEPPEEIYDGLDTLLKIEVSSRRRFLPAFLIEVRLAGATAAFHIVEGGRPVSTPVRARFSGRGIHRIETAEVRSLFPINFFVRRTLLPVGLSVLVFPAPRFCRAEKGGEPKGESGAFTTSGRGAEGEISRIADYRGGEPLKLIHWKLSARGGELMVKELSDTARRPIILKLGDLPGTGLEERLRCASYLVGALLRQNRPVGLRLDGKLLPAATGKAQKRRLLGELALYGRD